jgi:hypothetical protein
MAIAVRKPPSPSDKLDPRAYEYFFDDLHRQNVLVGTRTFDLPSISAGNTTTMTITVKGAVPDKQQTVEYGLPSNWNTGLLIGSAFVSALDTVTFAIHNSTSGSIDMGSATYSARVRP